MRTISTDLEAILRNRHSLVKFRVRVEDGDGALVDLTNFLGFDWVVSATWGDDVDARSVGATVTLHRTRYRDNLAPYDEVTRVNLNSLGSYDQLLDLTREIRIEIQFLPPDTASTLSTWVEVFRGQIDEISWPDDLVTLVCRDQMAVLEDTFIEAETKYSDNIGFALETILQEILDDNLGVSAPTLYVPSSPSWVITKFWTTRQSLADQLFLLVDQIGWNLKYKWDNGTSAFRLTLWEPARSDTTSIRTFTMDDYFNVSEIGITTKRIRNSVSVGWPDPTNVDKDGTPAIEFYTANDLTSQTRYGKRWCSLTEASSSNINTAVEAQSMADAIIADLAYPEATHSVEMPFFPFVELEDIYTFEANGQHYTSDFVGAVVAYSHSISKEQLSTSITLRENGPVGHTYGWWEEMLGEPGNAPAPTEREVELNALTFESNYGALEAQWTLNEPSSQPYRAGVTYEVYVTDTGGTPTDANLIGVTRQPFVTITSGDRAPIDQDMDVHVRSSNKGTKSAFTTQTMRIRPLAQQHLDAETQAPDGFATQMQQQTNGANYPLDGLEMETGTWGTDADIDDGTEYTSMASIHGATFLLLR